MKLSEELVWRGFVGQFSAPTLAEIVDGAPRVIYHGIDPSADSATVGNYVIWMLLRHLRNHGHTIIFLVGGGTGMIGDPKPDTERTLISSAEAALRVEKIKAQAQTILGTESIEFTDNYLWLKDLTLLTFLRDIGKHFTVNELIKKDAIAMRLKNETGLSYTEFAYPLLQAYDYLTLHQEKGCTLQVGGSDQWGNIIAGVDLVRRVKRTTVHALTTPLVIDKITGKKFGKSEGNAVWLDAEKTSPYSFYQFWLNVADENVIDYLKLYTLLPRVEILQLEAAILANPSAREAQKTLAREATKLVHGLVVSAQVERVSACLFGSLDLSELSSEELAVITASVPVTRVMEGTAIVEVLVSMGLAESKREARTFIEEGAVLCREEKVVAVDAVVTKNSSEKLALMRRGKRQVAVFKVE